MIETEDIKYMRLALEEAEKAFDKGEVPVGAVLIRQGELLTRGHNLKETMGDATSHAEIIALQKACHQVGGWRLTESTLYVTLEPCPMCAGALLQARVERLVYGAHDPKAGAVHSLYQLLNDDRLNHRLQVESGLLAEECGEILKRFFRSRRKEPREPDSLKGESNTFQP